MFTAFNQTRQAHEIRIYNYNSNTVGNEYKLLNYYFNHDVRKYSFSAKIVDIFRTSLLTKLSS